MAHLEGKSVALSSAEAEYMETSQASCEALWLRKFMVDLFGQELTPTIIHCDNSSSSSSLRIQCFMTGQSMLRSNTTSSEIMSKEEL